MTTLWREIVDIVDAQISVKDGLFIHDLRALMIWPLLPFLVALFFVKTPSTLANCIVLAMVIIEVPWVIFLLRRRAIKKQNWIEPSRYSDDINGY